MSQGLGEEGTASQLSTCLILVFLDVGGGSGLNEHGEHNRWVPGPVTCGESGLKREFAGCKRPLGPKPVEHSYSCPPVLSWLGGAIMSYGVYPKLPSFKLGAGPPGHCGHFGGCGHFEQLLDRCYTGTP